MLTIVFDRQLTSVTRSRWNPMQMPLVSQHVFSVENEKHWGWRKILNRHLGSAKCTSNMYTGSMFRILVSEIEHPNHDFWQTFWSTPDRLDFPSLILKNWPVKTGRSWWKSGRWQSIQFVSVKRSWIFDRFESERWLEPPETKSALSILWNFRPGCQGLAQDRLSAPRVFLLHWGDIIIQRGLPLAGVLEWSHKLQFRLACCCHCVRLYKSIFLFGWFIILLICKFVDLLIYWFVNILCYCCINLLLYWFIGSLIYWFIDVSISLIYWFIGFLIYEIIGFVDRKVVFMFWSFDDRRIQL